MRRAAGGGLPVMVGQRGGGVKPVADRRAYGGRPDGLLMAIDLALLRTIHVTAAAIWLGMGVFQLGVLLPAVNAEGPAGGALMRRMVLQGRLTKAYAIAAGTTVLAGLLLYGRMEIWSVAMTLRYRGLLELGIVLGLGGFILAVIQGRNIAKLKGLFEGHEGPPTQEMQGLVASITKRGQTIVAIVLTVFVLMMFAGRL